MFIIVDASVSIVDDDYVVEEGDSIMIENFCIMTWAVSMKCSVEYDFDVTLATPFAGKLKFLKSVYLFHLI